MDVPNSTADTEDFEFAALREAGHYRKAIIREFSPWLKGKVSEVGAGIGQMTEEISKLPDIQSLSAIEPDSRFHPYHEGKPWRLIKGTSTSLPLDEGLDCLILINVLEHIEKDEEELGYLYQRLQTKGGNVCVLVPARPELYSAIDRDFGHFRRYTKAELQRKMEEAGFQVVRCDYFNWAGYFAWGLSMKILKSRTFSPFGVRLYDRIIFPWTYWLESRVCRPFFGQSLIAVGRALS